MASADARGAELTPSQTVGPFFGFALPFEGGPELVAPEAPGAIRLEGQLFDGAGEPVPDGLVEVWHGEWFGRCRTDAEGAFGFEVAKPGAAGGRAGAVAGAPHLNVTVFARGLLRHLVTRIYFPDEPEANAGDPVLAEVDPARRATLVAAPDGGKLRFDIRLQGEGETVFFDVG